MHSHTAHKFMHSHTLIHTHIQRHCGSWVPVPFWRMLCALVEHIGVFFCVCCCVHYVCAMFHIMHRHIALHDCVFNMPAHDTRTIAAAPPHSRHVTGIREKTCNEKQYVVYECAYNMNILSCMYSKICVYTEHVHVWNTCSGMSTLCVYYVTRHFALCVRHRRIYWFSKTSGGTV